MSKFAQSDLKLIKKSSLYQGFFELNQYQFQHKLYQGGWSEVVTREVFERGHAVIVLPYDPVLDQVVLIEQLRFPASLTCDDPWLLEFVAGMIEAGESLEAVALRELQEEAGLTAQKLHFLQTCLLSPGGCSERVHFYLAIVDATQAEGIHGLDSEHEDIRVLSMDREQAYQLIRQGKIDNATTMLGLQWLQLNYLDYRK